MIYFAQPVDGGPIKIGTTKHIESRLRWLESHYDVDLALLATMPGDRKRETEIHRQFSHLRIGRSEQFRPASDLMKFIGKPLLVGANPGAVEKVGRTVFLNIEIDPELRRAIRIAAMEDGMSLKDWIDRVFREYLGMPPKSYD